MNSKFLLLPTALLAIPSATRAQSAKQSDDKKPMNIIYIMSDDHSYQTISAYNDKLISTPNIDRISDEGVLFQRSFVANSISGPSRACMLTGKHSHANGFLDNTNCVFDGSQQTLPKLLQAAGYQTAIVGKWHLNSDPTGFDHSDILIGQGIYYNPDFILNGEQVKTHGYATDLITERAEAWMDSRDPEKPFCLWLHHKAPHRTWMPDLQDLELFSDVEFDLPENFFDTYEGRQAAAEQEMSIIEDMDLVYDLKLNDKEKEI
ncbi:MAG: sulfatase-like hydrolase/transferase, partial [Rikenellaceae bacterium]